MNRTAACRNSILRCGCSVLAAALAAGCLVGPNFKKPTPSMPDAYDNSGKPATTEPSVTTAESIQDIQWWKTFNDPLLDSLVQQMLKENLDLLAATSRIREARASRAEAFSTLFPEIDGDGSYARSGAGANGPAGHSTNLYSAGFDAAWELDIFGGQRRGVEAADANVNAAIENQRDVMITLVGEVAVDYIQWRSYQRRLEIARQTLVSDEKTLALTRRRFGAGFVSKLDVANAAAEAATTRSQIPALEISERQSVYALAVLLGRRPEAVISELETEGPIPVTPPIVPIGLPSELLRRRPDIREAEAQLHTATAEIGVATADLFPKFSLTGDIQVQANEIRPLGNWTSANWSFGPSASWAIFTAGRVQANIEVQKSLTEQAMLAYRKSVLTALQDVESDLIAYSKEQERRDALRDAVTNDREALDLATSLYTGGNTDFLNVLTAQRSLFGVEDALAQSEANIAIDLTALYKALGGGWQTPGENLQQ